ncbi:beta-N-acetylglucosaminidase domain-containing protein (plasmid) [Hymenobacter tibetensis]|uniref:Beta-N-acetylglucosaminidase domain-containing protein n=1 Tax=Hymenobacter tibetensis TaxID=497967 RepID=A0ABY4D850_9BACT|nr:beta-N-acetylglucosaminidase domain-containing protein [Hymenobacter tibetensis]UOG77369.1 beta-N-acetylglucosaminidase domain-containing protein [Hymenobacter tibetensis]
MYPLPHQSEIGGERFAVAGPFQLKGLPASEAFTQQVLQEVAPRGSGLGPRLQVTRPAKADARLQRSEAYKLRLTPTQITIEAYDDRSVFYAVQTLRQLAQQDASGRVTLPTGTISDFPDVAARGTVEGFYGEPWSHQDRLEQLRFYGKLKLNTYIYGPKDDPYHTSPNWRKPYPEAEARQLAELVQEARRNKVDFVWAIHPGQDIRWNQADSSAILAKFGMMYDLGVRSFAVFFDDISGAGTDARMQAKLLNFVQQRFVRAKKDVAPLIMCPTEYNKSWANKTPGTYLDILGQQLDPAIRVMWTGNKVVDDITTEGLEWVNRRIRRPAFVWWNFPVSDYVRDHLLMGPAYGLDPQAAPHMSGFVSNPMDKAEASKPAIFSVALYSWNMQAYKPEQAWEAASRYIMPGAAEAFQLFSAHNSDPGPNGHRYRRDESAELQSYLRTFQEAYGKGQYAPEAGQRLQQEFQRIAQAPAAIRQHGGNARLLEQLAPWLRQFELLGRAGQHALAVAEARAAGNPTTTWAAYLPLAAALDSMATVNATLNQNPHQPGVKTGSLVLMPFVEEILAQSGAYLLGYNPALAGGPSPETSTPYRQSQKLGNQPLLHTNQALAYAPMLEVAYLDSSEYLGFKPAAALQVTALHYNLGGDKLPAWAALEASRDGNTWEPLTPPQPRGKGSVPVTDPALRYVRLRNASGKRQNFQLKELRLQVQPAKGAGEAVFACDGSVSTYQALTEQQPTAVALPQALQGAALAVLAKTNGATLTISGTRKGRPQMLYRGTGDYIQLSAKRLKNVSALTFSVRGSQAARIYELIRQQPPS